MGRSRPTGKMPQEDSGLDYKVEVGLVKGVPQLPNCGEKISGGTKTGNGGGNVS